MVSARPVVFVDNHVHHQVPHNFTRIRDNREANWHAGTRGLWESVRRLSPGRSYVIVLTLLPCAGDGCGNRGSYDAFVN